MPTVKLNSPLTTLCWCLRANCSNFQH